MKHLYQLLLLTVVLFATAFRAEGQEIEEDFIEQFKFSGGVVVALDFDDGKFIADLATEKPFVIHSLNSDKDPVSAAREEIRKAGVYGKVSCDRYNGKDLPYVDGLANIVLCQESCRVPQEELMRVLAPGGRLMTQGANGWKKKAKPVPGGMDEWNQFLRGADNNGVSQDDVGPPQRMRWHDVPEYGRSKSLSPSFTNMVSADGVLLTIEDRATTEDVNAALDYHLLARDAYNGIELWRIPMVEWGQWQTGSIKSIPTQQQRCLAAIGNTVYVSPGGGEPVRALAIRTGAERQVYQNTEGTAEFLIEGNLLFVIKGAPYKVDKRAGPGGPVELAALQLGNGKQVWTREISDLYTGGTFAVKGDGLVYHSAAGVTCLDSNTGEPRWTKPVELASIPPGEAGTPAKESRRGKKKGAVDPSAYSANLHPTLVLTDDKLFCAVGKTMIAWTLSDGEVLWTDTGLANYMKSSDLFVADGLVWNRDLKGRDPETGEIVRSLGQEMTGPMSHDRCYRNRITHRFYLNSASGGSDFVMLDGKAEIPNPWVRSTCGLAAMPANGMLYNAPYVCQCAIGTMVTGVNGLYNGTGNSEKRFTVEIEPRLEKGPAFGPAEGPGVTEEDWPTFRSSSERSGVSLSTTPRELATKWKVEIGSHLTAPVVALDTVYVADRDGYILHALNRESGVPRWTFIADGRIDSPPTYHQGMVLVGSRGGSVYCLRASDGELAWKFNGLPEQRLICDTGRLESAWPVHGSIMIHENTAYFAAGRSTFLDGGIAVFGLDVETGEMKHGRIIQGPYQDETGSFPVEASGQFQLEGFKADIFSRAGDQLFVRNQAFTPDLDPVPAQRVKTLHLLASPGFLNDSPQHRTYWTVDRDLRYGGAMGKFGSGPAGDTIAFDGKVFYEIRGYAPGRNLPGRGRDLNQLELYSVFSGSYDGMGEKENLSAIPAAGRWGERWNTPTPFAGHAIAAAGNTILAAGVPLLDNYSPEDIKESYEGKKGGIAWLLDAEDGSKLQEIRFEAAPVWDGTAIAHQQFFVSLKDGSLVCLAGGN